MKCSLKGRHFLKLLDYTPKEIRHLLDLSRMLKEAKYAGVETKQLSGKNIALIFEKDSTRTRCAFEVAAFDQGAHITYLGPSGSQMNKKESIEDTARVLGRFYDGIEYRGFSQDIVETLAKYAGVPVWNGLTNEFHPTQILADFLTVEEHLGSLKGKTLIYVGDTRNNMGNSLMIGCAKMGMHFTALSPRALWPKADLVEQARQIAKESGSCIQMSESIDEVVPTADVIYTDVWVSMGESQETWEKRVAMLKPYQVNASMIEKAKKDFILLHCLPSFHNDKTVVGKQIKEKFGLSEMEVTDAIFEGPHSVVFDQAENRMHTIKAVMVATLA